VYEQYPKDQQAAVFYALSLLTWSVDRDPLANPKKAIAILNQVFEENPDDPGAAHYLIHAADATQLAQTRVAGGTPLCANRSRGAACAPYAVTHFCEAGAMA
jgi:hypothetical protein